MRYSSARSGTLVFPYGHFYGSCQVRRRVEGLELSVRNADPDRTVERHSHEEAHLVLLLDGLYVTSAVGAPALCSGATLVYNPPGTTHRDRFEARRGVVDGRFFTLSISAGQLQGVADVSSLPERATHFSDPIRLSLAQGIARECVTWQPASALAAEAMALELLGCLHGEDRPERCLPRWLRTAHAMLADHCMQPPSIREIADATGVHPVHLARAFRRFYGCTPGAYVRRRRLERSAVLLNDTSRPLTDIALSCGFVDQSHFSRAFKQHFHIAPGAFRRASRAS